MLGIIHRMRNFFSRRDKEETKIASQADIAHVISFDR
jgi:hypothetical protein